MRRVGLRRVATRSSSLFRVIVVATLVSCGGCCNQIGPVVTHSDLTREELIRDLGNPDFRETTTVGEIVARRLVDDVTLNDGLKKLPATQPAELLKWQATCVLWRGDWFAILVDPSSGRMLQHDGKGLFAGRTRISDRAQRGAQGA